MSKYSLCCRLCLKKKKPLLDYNSNDVDNISFYDKIVLIMPSLISNSLYFLPRKLCTKCSKQLYHAHKFVQNCYESDRLLHDKSNFEHEEESRTTETAFNLEIAHTNLEHFKRDKKIKLEDFNAFKNNESTKLQQSIVIKKESETNSTETSTSICQAIDEHFLNPIKKPPEIKENVLERSLDIKNENVAELSNFDAIEDKCDSSDDTDSELCDSESDIDNKDEMIDSASQDNDDQNIDQTFITNETTRRKIKSKSTRDKRMKSKKYECDKCPKRCWYPNELKSHSLTHKEEQSTPLFLCYICGKTTTHSSAFHCHLRLHSGEKPYECPICKKKFAVKNDMKRHGKMHSDERNYQCDICFKSFKHSNTLADHKRMHAGIKPYECVVCKLKFRHAHVLKKHSKTHSGEKNVSCSVCGKSFLNADYLSIHMRVHSDNRPHECKTCNKRFKHSSTLIMHTRIHTGVRPYNCNVCHKTFRESSGLSRHMRSHTDERPFECDVCNKKFRIKSTLTAHKTIHTMERKYECSVCLKRFRTSSHLKKHNNVHMKDL